MLFVLLAVPAFAQSQATTGEVKGRIVDAQGAVLPGVTVTARNDANGYVRTAVTDDQGLFTMPLLPPGTYEVSMELAGFATARRPAQLTVGASVTLNQTLQLTGVAETITVTAASPLVETSTSIRTATVGSEAIDNLPINGRRFQDFVTLTPTAQVDTSRGQISLAGQRGINSNVNIDGADYNQPFFGGIRGGEREQLRLHGAPGVGAGVPGRRRRLLGRVRPIDGRSRQRGDQVGHQPGATGRRSTATGTASWPTRTRSTRPRRRPSSSSAARSAARSSAIGCSSSAPTSSRSSATPRAVAFNLTGIPRDRRQLPRPTTSTAASKRTFEATNDATALLGRVDYQ